MPPGPRSDTVVIASSGASLKCNSTSDGDDRSTAPAAGSLRLSLGWPSAVDGERSVSNSAPAMRPALVLIVSRRGAHYSHPRVVGTEPHE
jgi:hypothetical protein